MDGDGDALVASAIEQAAEAHLRESDKPRLLVEKAAPDRTVASLRDILAKTGELYDRGAPVRIVQDQTQTGAIARLMTPEGLILLSHGVCRPYALKEKKGGFSEIDVQLPRPFAVMYLHWQGEWQLPPLKGIASSPLLDDGGAILSGEGYDRVSGMWRERLPDLSGAVPERPSRADAEYALRLIRAAFRTFCFADADLIDRDGVQVVDVESPPGKDESAFLTALLTAVCRPSLGLAPGLLIRAAPMSGAGAGKGLLARCIAQIAFGREPHAVTGGRTAEELEKRISAELMEGNPVLFLDNLNNTAFRSDLLASAITESPARVRVLGRSQMVPLNATAFVVLTGNGLSVSEDLARRFITVELDPRTEEPEARRFPSDVRVEVRRDRARLLAAALTIWRWGRFERDLQYGRPIGSFEKWSRWTRDPLLALGCRDAVERLGEAKERDARRQATLELFNTWWDCHGDHPIALRDLDERVLHLVDPQCRGRQFVSSHVGKLAGTRVAGLILNRHPAAGYWSAATYGMERTGEEERHRDHRGHREAASASRPCDTRPDPWPDGREGECGTPMTPMVPMPSAAAEDLETHSGWTEVIE